MGKLDAFPAPLASRPKQDRPTGEREPKHAARGTPAPPTRLDLF